MLIVSIISYYRKCKSFDLNIPNLFCFFGWNKNSKLSEFCYPKNYLFKAQWETNLGIKLKHNFVICENHFNINDIERREIK